MMRQLGSPDQGAKANIEREEREKGERGEREKGRERGGRKRERAFFNIVKYEHQICILVIHPKIYVVRRKV